MNKKERRNLPERVAIVQSVVNRILENPSITLTVDTLQAGLNLPFDAAQRILARLASSGLVQEIKTGMFVRAPLPGAQPSWR